MRLKLTPVLILLVALVSAVWSAVASASLCDWPCWRQFKDRHIRNGQVLEWREQGLRTTSEGQAYSLFFALVADDRDAFDALLGWTERHLAGGDLTAQLPGWLWLEAGEGGEGAEGAGAAGGAEVTEGAESGGSIGDNNSASDADLWLAYTLMQAADRWQSHRYRSLGYLLARRIVDDETATVDDLGRVLLPGAQGFVANSGAVRLNPSYLTLPLLDYFAGRYPDSAWPALQQSSVTVVRAALQPRGIAPDWMTFHNGGWRRSAADRVGSYDGIRVYLWSAMLPDRHPQREGVLALLRPGLESLSAVPVPEQIDSQSGRATGQGPFGFSAAVAPLLLQSGKREAAMDHRDRAQQGWAQSLHSAGERSPPASAAEHYYNRVLSLFGLGWLEQRFHFDVQGRLSAAAWSPSCE